MVINPPDLPVRNEKVIRSLSENKELDRIYRMDRIFFAFPEERQKELSLPGEDFKFSRKQDCISLFRPERVKTINPKNPVDPV